MKRAPFTLLCALVQWIAAGSEVVTAPLRSDEILPEATGVSYQEWAEGTSSFPGGTVLSWSEVPSQVYSSVVAGRSALRFKEDGTWFNNGKSLGGPGLEAQGGYRIAFEWEFDLTSDTFETWIVGRDRFDYVVLVDGHLVGKGNARLDSAQGSIGFQKFRFPAWGTRRITILSNNYVGGIAIPRGAEVANPPRRHRKRCVVLGDSITEAFQFPIGPIIGGWAQRLRHHMGWELIASGSGGTGYLQTRGTQVKLRDRLAQDCFAYAPDIVIVAMGINGDITTETARAAMADEAALCFAEIRANLPLAKIVVLSPFWPYSPKANNLDMGRRISEKATAAGVEFINVLGWFTDENHGRYFTFAGDHTHPNEAGHAMVAERLALELYRVNLGRDVDASSLANLSVRSSTGAGGEALIVGFVVSGPSPKQVLIRAVGPTLGQFGVTGLLENPRLALYRGATKLGENDDWHRQGNRAQIAALSDRVSAFPLPSESRDAALLSILEPGAYSLHISGENNATGNLLLEVYEIR